MFYPGKVHTVASESEAGKTWFVVHAVADEIRDGNHVVYIDFEDDAGPIVHRLLALQVVPDLIRARFHYIRPEVAIMQGESREDLEGTLNAYGPTLVVIEGVTEAMSVHGYNPLDNAEVAAFGRRLPRWIAETGPAVVCVDHVTKASDGRGRYAIGAVHKLNAVDGAAYLLENVAPFVIGRTGRTRVRIAKDRPGYLRAKSLPGTGGLSWFGDFVLISHAAEFAEAEVEAPRERDDDFRPTELMRRICDLLAEKGPQSQRTIRAAIGGRSETVTSALAYLALDGYVSDSTPRELLRPYPGGES
ncbi:AAA family ATPase [Nocardioides sp. MAH-18]|uniref:AAA family ATPase n=1 Tax=Nocardioides agri TaxID=2682843 RepID=A0A6L6XNJ6_9ACTN|nr:AAA family ATPase [Nocardioides sp. MAH-18]MBA2953449.1 AAA family ATPase [Nocardioides sp. CGMCC 1.13656]MVQ48317.1 AAA family ATPase [Nocardioides sp. MAH-18]